MEGIYVDPSEKCSMWQNQHQEVDWVSIKINSISLITSNITKRQGFGDDDHVRGEWQFSHQLRSWGKRKIEWNLWWCYIPQKKIARYPRVRHILIFIPGLHTFNGLNFLPGSIAPGGEVLGGGWSELEQN